MQVAQKPLNHRDKPDGGIRQQSPMATRRCHGLDAGTARSLFRPTGGCGCSVCVTAALFGIGTRHAGTTGRMIVRGSDDSPPLVNNVLKAGCDTPYQSAFHDGRKSDSHVRRESRSPLGAYICRSAIVSRLVVMSMLFRLQSISRKPPLICLIGLRRCG